MGWTVGANLSVGAAVVKEGDITASYNDDILEMAAATTRLRLGTAVALVVQRDPIYLAKEVATLDLLSGGRWSWGSAPAG